MRKLLLFLLAVPLAAQTINPNSQITWPRVSGDGSPIGQITCPSTTNTATTATTGTPYTDKAGPHYWQCGTAGWFQVDGAGGSVVDFKNLGAALGGAFAANPQVYDYDNVFISPDSGYTNGVMKTDSVTGKWVVEVPTSSNGIEVSVAPPIAGQHVFIRPTGFSTVGPNNYCTVPSADNISGQIFMSSEFSTFPPSFCSITWTFTGALAAQAPWVIPGNVTAVYAYGVSSLSSDSVAASFVMDSVYQLRATGTSYPQQQVTALTTFTGANLESKVAVASLGRSGTSTPANSVLNVNAIGYVVYYTGTAPPADTNLQVASPLNYNPSSNTLGLDPVFPSGLIAIPVAQLPPFGLNINTIKLVKDSSNCSTTAVPALTFCYSNGTSWGPYPFSGGGGVGTYFTETVTCTTTCTLAHTPTTFLNLARNGLVQYYTSDFTQSGVTITLVDPAVSGDTFYAQYYY